VEAGIEGLDRKDLHDALFI